MTALLMDRRVSRDAEVAAAATAAERGAILDLPVH